MTGGNIQSCSSILKPKTHLPWEKVKEDADDHVNGVGREEEGEGGGEEPAHAGADGREVSSVQDVAPILDRLLDVHVQ